MTAIESLGRALEAPEVQGERTGKIPKGKTYRNLGEVFVAGCKRLATA